jgi:hypothetical protein
MVHSLLAGGEWIDDVNALRAGGVSADILGMTPAAASTVSTFLRAVTPGHARQFDAAQEDLHQRAWDAGARPAGRILKLDLDSSLIETYGLQKQGGKHFTYQGTRGYHPLLAVLAESDVVHSRLREGRASSGRGAGSFARQALARVQRLAAGFDGHQVHGHDPTGRQPHLGRSNSSRRRTIGLRRTASTSALWVGRRRSPGRASAGSAAARGFWSAEYRRGPSGVGVPGPPFVGHQQELAARSSPVVRPAHRVARAARKPGTSLDRPCERLPPIDDVVI